jgi:hypothetical protein
MFKIIGGDGRQYGPITPEQLRDWIAAGRANGQTMVQREGETDWKPLSSLAEFADALAGTPAPAQLPPAEPLATSGVPDPNALANEVIARGVPVSIGSCLGRAWDMLMSDFWPIIGVSALILVILSSVGLIAGPLVGGLFCYYLKKIRRQPAQLSDAFVGFSQLFLPLFLGALVASLLVTVGFAACVIPGVYLAVAWKLTLPIITDKRLGFWEAMEVSRKVATQNWWMLFLFAIVCGLINFGGLLLCGLGFFVTWPWTLLALTFLYEDIFGSQPASAA